VKIKEFPALHANGLYYLIQSIIYIPAAKLVATADYSGKMQIWDETTGKLLREHNLDYLAQSFCVTKLFRNVIGGSIVAIGYSFCGQNGLFVREFRYRT